MTRGATIGRLAAAAALLAAGAAAAQQPSGLLSRQQLQAMTPEDRASYFFQVADTNRDGVIRQDEGVALARVLFRAQDVDSSNTLARGEFGRQGPVVNRVFARMDTNNDGVLSEAEYLGAAPYVFDRWDQNNDGVVTLAETLNLVRQNAGGSDN